MFEHCKKLTILALLASAAGLGNATNASSAVINSDAYVIDAEDRAADVVELRSLGFRVPDKGIVLEKPFALPLTPQSFVVPRAWYGTASRGPVNADALRADLPLIKSAFTTAYGGYHRAVELGLNWDLWFKDWDTMLAKQTGKSLDIPTAFAPLKLLYRIQVDNHTGVMGARAIDFLTLSRSALLASSPRGNCTEGETKSEEKFIINPDDPATQAKPVRVGTTSAETSRYYIVYAAKRGELARVKCGNEWIGAQATVDDSPPSGKIALMAWAIKNESTSPEYRLLSPDVGYLRLPTFSKPNTEKLAKLIEKLPASAGREKVVIFDLRSNEGGDAPIDLVARWLPLQKQSSLERMTSRLNNSCLYAPLRLGYAAFSTTNMRSPLSEKTRQALQAGIDALIETPDGECKWREKVNKGTWNYTQREPFKVSKTQTTPRILAIVNNFCASDCEAMVTAIAYQPGNVVAGVNTSGVAQFIQPGYFVLPNTRLVFRVALGISDVYGDGRSVDGYGLDVDVLLPDQDMYRDENLLKLANELMTKN